MISPLPGQPAAALVPSSTLPFILCRLTRFLRKLGEAMTPTNPGDAMDMKDKAEQVFSNLKKRFRKDLQAGAGQDPEADKPTDENPFL